MHLISRELSSYTHTSLHCCTQLPPNCQILQSLSYQAYLCHVSAITSFLLKSSLSYFPNIFLFWFSYCLSGWSCWISFKHCPFGLPFKFFFFFMVLSPVLFSFCTCFTDDHIHFPDLFFLTQTCVPTCHWVSPSEWATRISNSTCPTGSHSSHPQTCFL